MSKKIALIIVCMLWLSPSTLLASDEWRYLTATADYKFDFSTDFGGIFPYMAMHVKITPTVQFKKGDLPARAAAKAAYITLFVEADCSSTILTPPSYSEARFYDRNGKLVSSVPEFTPTLTGLKQFEQRLTSTFCRQSPYEGPGRWEYFATRGTDFQKVNIYVDRKSFPASGSTDIGFWWEIMPAYPVAYAKDQQLFDSANETIKYTWTLVHSRALCPNKQMMDDEKLYYDKNSKLISRQTDNTNFENVVPDTLGEKLFRYACDR
jgi:hypothetical protein